MAGAVTDASVSPPKQNLQRLGTMIKGEDFFSEFNPINNEETDGKVFP